MFYICRILPKGLKFLENFPAMCVVVGLGKPTAVEPKLKVDLGFEICVQVHHLQWQPLEILFVFTGVATEIGDSPSSVANPGNSDSPSSVATPGNSLRFHPLWSAPPVSALACSGGPGA